MEAHGYCRAQWKRLANPTALREPMNIIPTLNLASDTTIVCFIEGEINAAKEVIANWSAWRRPGIRQERGGCTNHETPLRLHPCLTPRDHDELAWVYFSSDRTYSSSRKLPAQSQTVTMTKVPELRASPIEGLPVELLQAILSHLPDIPSLQAAVVSCPLFYHAFVEVEMVTATQLLLKQIDESVLPDAMAAAESSQLRPHDTEPESREAIVDFVNQDLRQRPTPPIYWSLRDALRISRLHFSVDWFAEDFCKKALDTSSLSQSRSITTLQERRRIQRALYWFEIYCNLFRENPVAHKNYFREDLIEKSCVYEEQRTLFFSNFARWEVEQLGCIHDFLVRAISPG